MSDNVKLHVQPKENIMNDTNEKPNFVHRVIQNDSAKKGVAAAAAGILIALVSEALWPSD